MLTSFAMGPYPDSEGQAGTPAGPSGHAHAAKSRRGAWPRRAVLGTFGTAGAGVAMVAFAAAAFANAANPLPVSTGQISPAGGTAVRVDVSGMWNWGELSGSSTQSDCAGRYGVGWSVDWWGMSSSQSATSFPDGNLTGSIVTWSGQGAPALSTGTITPGGSLKVSGSNTYFHTSSDYNGFDADLCDAPDSLDANHFPQGPWGSPDATYAIYPSAADVPKQLCVNFYDPHGKLNQPSGSSKDYNAVSNDDNSISKNAFDPTSKSGYCFTPTFSHPLSMTVAKSNDASQDGNFNQVETANSAGQAVWFKVTVQNTSAVTETVDSLTDVYPGSPTNPPACNTDANPATGNAGTQNLVNSDITSGSTATCYFKLANYAPSSGDKTNDVTVTVHEKGLTTNTLTKDATSTVSPPATTLTSHILRCDTNALVSSGNLHVVGGGLNVNVGDFPTTVEPAGNYSITATAPTGFDLVNCPAHGYDGSATQFATLPPSATLNFYVLPSGSPNLNVQKFGPSTGVAGDTGEYEVRLSNSGSATAPGPITFYDQLPVGETFVQVDPALTDAGMSCTAGAVNANGQLLTCHYNNDLLKNTHASVFVVVRYAAGTEGQTLTDCAGLTTNNETACVPTKIKQPKLTINKVGPATGVPGGNGTYTITVKNVGDGPATSASFVDNLPAGETFVSASGDYNCHTTADPQVISCTAKSAVLPLQSGDSLSVAVLVSYGVNTGGQTLTDCAVLPTGDQSCVPTIIQKPDVVIHKIGPATGTAGGNGTYTITVSNNGQATANNVTFTDNLPVGETYAGSSSSQISCSVSANPQVVNCSLNGPLAPGASVSVDVTVSYGADTGGKTLTDCAQLSATNQSCVPTKISGQPAITVVKTNDANGDGIFHDTEAASAQGDSVTFQVVVTNTSNTTVVIDSVSDAYAAVVANECPQLLGAVLDPGESLTCQFTIDGYAPAAGTSLLDTVTVNGHEQGNPGNTTTGADTSTVLTRQPPSPGSPDLAIVKTADKAKAKVGDTLVYSLQVSNVGDGATTGTVTVTDSVPAGLDLVTVDGGSSWDCSVSGQDISCTYLGGAVQPGDTLPQITIVTTVNTAGVPRVINTGVVSTPGDLNPTNDRSTVKTPVTNVLGEKIPNTPPPTTLPFTGDHTGSMLPAGLGAVLLGLMFLVLGRRRRRHA